jgi:integrase
MKLARSTPTLSARGVPREATAHPSGSRGLLARFLEAARTDRLYALWVLVASTGMRRSELCGLQLPALNLDTARSR